MNIRTLFLFLLTIVCCFDAAAQKKIKYKDLYPLLEARRFDEAEPFLREFLKEEPNHASGVYNMAKVYDLRAREADVLKETALRTAYCDSAIVFYHRSNSLIDERELKKNDEFYQEFNRRDLRTGKFGISLSDVQFDLDQKIEAVKKLKSLGNALSAHFNAFSAAYDSCIAIYGKAKEELGSEEVLQLAGATVIDGPFQQLKQQYDTFQIRFNSYRNTLSEMENPSYSQRTKVIGLDGFPVEAGARPDYYGAEILVFNFKDWVMDLEEKQDGLIDPIFKEMTAFGQKLKDISASIGVDSTLQEAALPTTIDLSLLGDIRRVDEFCSMEPYFNIQCRWMHYQYITSPVYFPSWLDSARFGRQLALREAAVAELETAKGMVDGMSKYDPVQEYKKYARYLSTAHGSLDAYRQYLSEWSGKLDTEVKRLRDEMKAWVEKASWAYSVSDTVYVGAVSDFPGTDMTWGTVQTQALDSTVVAAGLRNDASAAFVSMASADRKILWISPVSLTGLELAVQDPSSIDFLMTDVRDGDPVILAMVSAFDANGVEFIKGVLAKVSLTKGTIQWQNLVQLNKIPRSLRYDPQSGEIIASMGEQMDQIVVFNPDGTLRE